MSTAIRSLFASLLILAGASSVSAQASGETNPVDLLVGFDGDDIAAAFGTGWSQGLGSDFTCRVLPNSPNTLVVYNTTRDCDNDVARFTFALPSGTLMSNHFNVTLKLFCASPLQADINFGAGDLPINVGMNSYTVGVDTIEIDRVHPSISFVGSPALPPALLFLLCGAGAVWIGRMALRAKARA